MNRKIIAWLLPPAAVICYGCATGTAAPIGVFWLAGIVSLVHSFMGGTPSGWEGSPALLVGLGMVMWLIAAVWARLVIHGVEEDISNNSESSLHRRVLPRLEETDPFKVISWF
ncbi:MAG: hypothetical protein U1F76_06755 [Candidatus Competibacteraceae bacterium]